MKAIVTGATGFIGKWLVRELIAQENEVTVIVRNKEKIPELWKQNAVEVIEASLQEIAFLEKQDFSKGEYDIFFHFAWTGTSGMERADCALQLDNVQFACDAVKLAKKLGCTRFVNAGSIMEYETMQHVPTDSAMPGMGSIYSIAKLTADLMARTVATKEEIGYINVIISNIYGAGEKSARFLNIVLRKMLINERVPLTHGKQLYDFIYVTDAVKAIIFATVNGGVNESFYIGNASQRPLKEFVLEMKRIVKSESELGFGEVPFTGAYLSYNEFDTAKLGRMGFVPQVSFEQGVRLTEKWILEEKDGYKF